MRLMWMGTASLLFAEGDDVIAFDPFPGIPLDSLDGRKRTFPDTALYLRAKNVFVTHGHFDHILYIPALYGSSDAVVHATAAPCETLARSAPSASAPCRAGIAGSTRRSSPGRSSGGGCGRICRTCCGC